MIKNYLIFQKVYWFSEEWKEFLDFLFKEKIYFFLLSKKLFFSEFNVFRNYLSGECVLIDVSWYDMKGLNDFLKNIQKWNNKIFFLGMLYYNKNWIFIQKYQFLNILNYYFYKNNNFLNVTLLQVNLFYNLLFLFCFFSQLKFFDIYQLQSCLIFRFSYYY